MRMIRQSLIKTFHKQMNEDEKHMRQLKKTGSFALRAGCCLLACFLLLSGCMNDPLDFEGYEIIGDARLQQTLPYDFTGTLAELYPHSSDIVLAHVSSTNNHLVNFTIDRSYLDVLKEGEAYTASYDIECPLVDAQYILFLNRNVSGSLHALFDSAGWIRINGDLLFPSGQNSKNSSGSFEQAQQTLDRLNEEILLPPRFYFYRELEDLVKNSNYIFIGRLQNTENVGEQRFFLRSIGVEENISAEAQLMTFIPEDIIKGDLSRGKPLTILLSSAMLNNTIVSSNMKTVTASLDEVLIQLEEDTNYYLVFAIDASQHEEYSAFFTNPLQGFVALIRGDAFSQTVPNPVNSPFYLSLAEEDLIADIQYLIDHEPDIAYYPFSLESQSPEEETTP